MRYALLLATLALACAADPVLLPDASPPADAGPCGGACGAGTVCEGGACVAVDAGAVDGPQGDGGGGADVVDVPSVDLGAPDAGAADAGSDGGPVDASFDVGPVDALPAGCASTTAGNCCGVACAAPAHGVAFCGGGRCGVESCEAGWGDCDGVAANGCETNTQATAAHCGACGAPCGAGRACASGACVLACPSGRANCDGNDANGCEADLASFATCGRCDVRCVNYPHVTTRCLSGGGTAYCSNVCDSGYINCGTADQGCNVMPQTDSRNCGGCRVVCAPGRSCVLGRCV